MKKLISFFSSYFSLPEGLVEKFFQTDPKSWSKRLWFHVTNQLSQKLELFSEHTRVFICIRNN